MLILLNLQKPWTIACKDVSRVFEIEYSTYRILNRLELCECSLTTSNYLLSQTDANCRDMPEARDGYFTTYYAFNKIILDVITVKFDIQVDDRTITQSTLLHDDIPGYNLPNLEFVLPPVNDDEDLILEEKNPEIYAHLENILVHMIEAQDVAIFKSQKDYTRNKQKLSEYICWAPFINGAAPFSSLKMEHPFINRAAPFSSILSGSVYKWCCSIFKQLCQTYNKWI